MILVTGHKGLVGSAVVRALNQRGQDDVLVRSREELDLTCQVEVKRFFQRHKFTHVYHCAAHVGGILANSRSQYTFLYENLQIQNNVIHAALETGVKKLLFLGSSCIYPKLAPQPIVEESLMTGPLEQTNEGYAIAKIAGLKLCEMAQREFGCNFISAMPTNIYGPGDDFSLTRSHVISALMTRMHNAKRDQASEVVIWGTGTPLREPLYVDDLAQAMLMLMDSYNGASPINVGSGEEYCIKELANYVAEAIGFTGLHIYDTSKPDGTPRKFLDSSKIRALGWEPKVSLREGLKRTYEWAIATGALK